jgi:peptidoglycan/xylan/chitin deacetylase (PgdA/CDA1 family)
MHLQIKTIGKFLYPKSTWEINTSEKNVFLTFDDGPTPDITEWVLEILKKYSAHATFFCLGKNVLENEAIYKQIKENGHSIGNHTYSHLNGWKTRQSEYLLDVQLADEFLKTPLFRPPYGKIRIKQYFALCNKYNVIMWDVLSRDYDRTFAKEKCLKLVTNHTNAGSIIVFHDSVKAYQNLAYVLPRTLDWLSENNYKISAIPERKRYII